MGGNPVSEQRRHGPIDQGPQYFSTSARQPPRSAPFAELLELLPLLRRGARGDALRIAAVNLTVDDPNWRR